MKVISIWNPKGGQGKSFLAIHLAGAAVDMGLKVIIIDRDMQGTCVEFHGDGHLPYPVLSDIPEQAPDVDLVLLDHMASDYEVPTTDPIVMPFLPNRSQYAKYIQNYQKAQKAGKNIISVVTGADKRVKIERDTVATVKKQGVFEIKRNAAFGKADAEYRTIFDTKFNKEYAIEASRQQVTAILTAILREL